MRLIPNNDYTRKSIFRRYLIPILFALCVALFILSSCGDSGNRLFKKSDEEFDIMDNLIYFQDKVDKRIESEMHNKNNTFDKPLVIENPYDTSPLTAIIIFNTDTETSIDVSINGNDYIKFEKSKEHAIPIYGLFDDYANKVVMKDESGNSKDISIQTKKYSGAVMSVEKTSDNLSDEFFLVSPDYERTSIYDKNGRLLWYLDYLDNEGAVIFLGGGRFLISDPYQGSGGIRINYSGFMDMDYLGKIHNLYVGEYGYHHEIVRIKDGSEFLIPGHDEESPFMQAILYSVDANTMEVKNKLDFYEIFHSISPEWTDTVVNDARDGKFNFVINGVDYEEESGDVIVSVRSTGMLMRVNLETAEIKWIFADPANTPGEMKKYLLKPADNTRYPYGQHEPKFLSNGRISYHNNDIDFMLSDLSLSKLKNNYSSNEILKINEKDKTLQTEWTFDGSKKILSRMSGSFELLEDNHKLISYGSAVKEEYLGRDNILASDFKYTQALMMELDDKDDILWRATFPSVIHKVYKSKFYDDGVIPNYKLDQYNLVDGQDADTHKGTQISTEEIISELVSADKFDGLFSVAINRAVIDSEYEDSDEIKILFVSEDGVGTEFMYKRSGDRLPIVNSGKYGVRIAGLSGRQKAYVSVSGKWYDTGKIYNF